MYTEADSIGDLMWALSTGTGLSTRPQVAKTSLTIRMMQKDFTIPCGLICPKLSEDRPGCLSRSDTPPRARLLPTRLCPAHPLTAAKLVKHPGTRAR